MHYFVFQNPKHLHNRWSYSHRIKLNSYRGNFDLERIRIALKMNYTITGYGDHPIFKTLDKIERAQHFKGHILEVKDPKGAMWIKLNYDLIGKGGTKLLGTYKDLDLEYLNQRVNDIKLARNELSALNTAQQTYNGLTRAFSDFNKRVSSEHNVNWSKINTKLEQVKLFIEDDTELIGQRSQEQHRKIADSLQQVSDHIDSCRLGTLVGV